MMDKRQEWRWQQRYKKCAFYLTLSLVNHRLYYAPYDNIDDDDDDDDNYNAKIPVIFDKTKRQLSANK